MTIFKKIKSNWKSGFAVSLVSLPMAISLAVASNSTPVAGIITAVWAGLVASIFCGSNYNIIGPTGALSGILATFALLYGVDSLSMLAILAGLFIFIAYLFKLEKYIIFFPASTIHGFILGVSIILTLNQLNFALGLKALPIHEKFIQNILETFNHLSEISISDFSLFSIFLILLFVLVKLLPKIPGAIIVAPISILVGYLSFQKILPFSLQVLGTKFGDIHPTLFLKPHLSFSFSLIIPSMTIAIIGILETLISAKIADGMTKTKHAQRKEMLGLSLANIASGIAGGIPATAALARTTLNINAGCTNKISATIGSIVTALIALLLLTYFKFMPLATLAAILVFVAYRMIEKERFYRMFKLDKKNFILALIVATITVFEDPIIGLLFGASIAMFSFMARLSKGQFELASSSLSKKEQHQFEIDEKAEIDKKENHIKFKEKQNNILIYSIKNQLAYINSQSHIAQFEKKPPTEKYIILNLKDLYFIDLDGIDAFDQIIEILEMQNKEIFISNANPLISNMLEENSKFTSLKNKGHIFESIPKTFKFIEQLI